MCGTDKGHGTDLFLFFFKLFLFYFLLNVFSGLSDLCLCLWAQDNFSGCQLIDECKDGIDEGKDVIGVLGNANVKEDALGRVFLGDVGGS